jgi:hypothetical protein
MVIDLFSDMKEASVARVCENVWGRVESREVVTGHVIQILLEL